MEVRKTSEKKVVSRNVAIALGIIVIFVLAGLVGAIANYTSIINAKDKTIASKDSQIASKNSQISNLQNQVDNLTSIISGKDSTIAAQYSQIRSLNLTLEEKDSQISSLNSEITDLQNQVNDLNSIINLGKSTVWVDSQTVSQPASSYTYWMVSAGYAGCVSVWVQSSTTSNTYVEVIWSSSGVSESRVWVVSYDNTITVGTSGTAFFPILPSSSIEIRVGNTNLISGATETVTITYYY